MPVYFVKGTSTGLIKIGRAKHVQSRLRDLQIGSPDVLTLLAVIPDATDDAPYHERFAEDWVRGEWFRPSEALLAFIQALPKVETETLPLKPKPQYSVFGSREWLAKEALKGLPFCKPGGTAQRDLMKMYARLKGWKSWRDVPELQEYVEVQHAN